MLTKYLRILSNPLLYYVDKTGKAVFRNFCFFMNTGCVYRFSIPKANAGKALEYKMKLDKYLKRITILTPIIFYLIYIHLKFSIFSLLFFEILALVIILGVRLYFSGLYSKYLVSTFGKYELSDFLPPVTQEKGLEYINLFKSKIIAIIVLVCTFFIPSIFIDLGIKGSLKSKTPHYTTAIKLSNIYLALYPQNINIYEKRAYARYIKRDYYGAIKDYKKIFQLTGRKFDKKDSVRFANLLYLKSKIMTPRDALRDAETSISKKRLSTLNKSQLLWIKSIFRIENNLQGNIIQEYEDLISSLNKKDIKNQFYISCDLAYIMYLMQEYNLSINNYNAVLSFADSYKDLFSEKEIQTLYAERGWAKKRVGDEIGALEDFTISDIPYENIPSFEPNYEPQKFVLNF